MSKRSKKARKAAIADAPTLPAPPVPLLLGPPSTAPTSEPPHPGPPGPPERAPASSAAAPKPSPRAKPPAPAKPPRTWSLPLLGPSEGSAPRPARARALKWIVLGSILVAWLFGFGMRAAWQSHTADTPLSQYEGHRLLTTADAYFYASGVQHEVSGTLNENPRVPTDSDSVVVLVSSLAVKLFGVSVDDVCLWMPAILAPLVAVPLVLLGLLFGEVLWGFLAALIAVLGFSYWNRTVPGYFDTDMVTIPFVFGTVSLVAAAFWRKRPLFGSIAGSMTVIAPWIHPGSERVLAAVAIGAFGYTLVFERRDPRAYRIALALLLAYLPIPIVARFAAIGAFELAFWRIRVPAWAIAALGAVTLVIACWKNSDMDLVLGIVGIHFGGGGRGAMPGPSLGVHFPGVAETVAELSNPTLDKLAERVAGNGAIVALGVIGFIAAAWRYRPILMFTPLLALGTVVATQGQRFTIFAVPVIALGAVWSLTLVGRLLATLIVAARTWAAGAAERARRWIQALVPVALMPFVLGPAVVHATTYPGRTAVLSTEAAQLTMLGKQVAPGDFVITWWDYAYGAWYHSGANTIVDGSKQNEDLWIAAEVLFTHSQREAASLMRLAAEEQPFHEGLQPFIETLLRRFTATTERPVTDFIPALRAGEVKLPAPTRQVFFYLPWRILQIVPNVAKLRPAKGLVPPDEMKLGTFIAINQTNPDGTPVQRSGWTYDAPNKVIVGPRGERVKVLKSVDVTIDQSSHVRTHETEVDPAGKVCVVNLEHSRMSVYLDRDLFDSVLSQLLFQVKPDPALFQPVSYGRGGVIYKVML